ncbi:Uncharacterised protein [Vibrio cholerae]|nr:Uncharacterised protein [Vibrio cholerae]CSI55694.1 Uncharacterised protein [Vibrio cholerae]
MHRNLNRVVLLESPLHELPHGCGRESLVPMIPRSQCMLYHRHQKSARHRHDQ